MKMFLIKLFVSPFQGFTYYTYKKRGLTSPPLLFQAFGFKSDYV